VAASCTICWDEPIQCRVAASKIDKLKYCVIGRWIRTLPNRQTIKEVWHSVCPCRYDNTKCLGLSPSRSTKVTDMPAPEWFWSTVYYWLPGVTIFGAWSSTLISM
jgi:hypothetical protein